MCPRSASRASFRFFSDSSRCRRAGAHSRRWCVSSFKISIRRAGARAAQPPLEVSREASSRIRSARLVRAFVEPRTDARAPDASVASRVPSSARRTRGASESVGDARRSAFAAGLAPSPGSAFGRSPSPRRSHVGQNQASSGTARRRRRRRRRSTGTRRPKPPSAARRKTGRTERTARRVSRPHQSPGSSNRGRSSLPGRSSALAEGRPTRARRA